MKQITVEWVTKAEGDFAIVKRECAVKDTPNYDGICFHAQQCVEKYLKARLCEADIHILARYTTWLRYWTRPLKLSRHGKNSAKTLLTFLTLPLLFAIPANLPMLSRLSMRSVAAFCFATLHARHWV